MKATLLVILATSFGGDDPMRDIFWDAADALYQRFEPGPDPYGGSEAYEVPVDDYRDKEEQTEREKMP